MPSSTATSSVPGSWASVPVVMRSQVQGAAGGDGGGAVHEQTHLRAFVHTKLVLVLVLK